VTLAGGCRRGRDVHSVHEQVEAAIQAGMDALAAKRTLPVFG
jgi:hypothetical protein